MTGEQRSLWEELNSFELDNPAVEFSFTDRLVRENGWDYEFALRTIDEYKKFIFLIVCSGHPCTPSDEIDQVWHLHLLYTESYWKDMCLGILNKEVHHGPTKGVSQRNDFKDYYSMTKDSYLTLFKYNPPSDIWPSSELRFKYVNFRRVNLHLYKIRKKWKF